MQQPVQQSTLKELDLGYYITHYARLLWRWKAYVFIAMPIVMAGLGVYVAKHGAMKPALEATVMLGFENSEGKTAVEDIGESTPIGRLALIKAKGFLSEIVDILSLRLQVKNINLHEVFSSVRVDSLAVPAKYRFKVDEGVYEILMTSKLVGVKNKLVESGTIAQLDSIKFAGVSCRYSSEFLKSPFGFDFYIVRQRDAVAWLIKNLIVYDRDILKTRGREKENFVGVAMLGTDYKRITRIINTVADEFVKRSLGFKKRKSKETLSVLKQQLGIASKQLAVTQDAVRKFRGQHPNIALVSELQGAVSSMAGLETSMHSSRLATDDAQRIQNELAASKEAEIPLVLNEALLFLAREGVVTASVLQVELNQLLQLKSELHLNYAKSHPKVTENRNKIAVVKGKVNRLLGEYIKDAANKTYQQSSRIQEITRRMQGLPIQQLRLAELERNATVAAEIHSSVLSRYNQAKISDAVEVTDVFVMDYAIEPEPSSDLLSLLKTLAFGLFVILVVSFGPAVAYDLFDKTVRTESELIKLLPFTFLESIPVIPSAEIKSEKKKKRKNDGTKASVRVIDPKLVTASYTPDFTNELFRSLRSKIMLRLHEVPKKHLLVTSMGMNEGKSLITANLAITMAQQKLRTILIDGDIRRGVQHNTFVLQKKPGLSDFLFSEDEVTAESITELIQPTHVPNLSLIASGPNVPNPSELLGMPRLESLIKLLSNTFDIILFDTPPIGASVDAAIVSNIFSGAIVVVKAGATNAVALKKRLKEFPNLQGHILGMVLNQSALDANMKKYKYYSYLY